MRELKFRAWDKKNNKFFTPTFKGYKGNIEDLTITFHGELVMRTFNYSAIHQSLFSNRFILNQYTGLKDVNGKEIYEGDIVSIHNKEDGIRCGDRIVKFENFGFTPFTELSHFQEYAYEIDYYEVIGNIYENHEYVEYNIN